MDYIFPIKTVFSYIENDKVCRIINYPSVTYKTSTTQK